MFSIQPMYCFAHLYTNTYTYKIVTSFKKVDSWCKPSVMGNFFTFSYTISNTCEPLLISSSFSAFMYLVGFFFLKRTLLGTVSNAFSATMNILRRFFSSPYDLLIFFFKSRNISSVLDLSVMNPNWPCGHINDVSSLHHFLKKFYCISDV